VSSPEVHVAPLPDNTQVKLFLKRSHEYCNDMWDTKGVGGKEGSLPFEGNKQYELLQVHMIARHGDRAPVYETFLSKGLQLSCGLPKQETHWPSLSDFVVKRLSGSGITPQEDIDLFPGFNEHPCQLGELTHKGYKQHFQLGQFLRKQYSSKLTKKFIKKDPDWSNSIFVHSTYYPRTLASAASFLLGFLPNRTSTRKSVPINYSQGSNLYAAPRGVTLTYRWCTRLREMTKRNSNNPEVQAGRMFFSDAMNTLGNMYKKSPSKLPEPTVIVDNLLVRMCHKERLPCHNHQCIRLTLAQRLLEYADWTIEHKYMTTNSILMMQPFIYNSILKKMFEVTDRLAIDKDDYDKFLLYFAHDSTITPLLTMMGIPPKKWIPYSSRLVMELWKEISPSDASGYGPYYVRVLFNGQGWTQKLPLPENSFALVKDLVKLRAFKHFLTTGKFREKSSYDKECGIITSTNDIV